MAELKRFETEEDWKRLFDDALNAAVEEALAKVQRQEEQAWEEQRRKHAVRLPAARAARTPKLNVMRISIELYQRYGTSSLTLNRDDGTYVIDYTLTYTSSSNNKAFHWTASAAEAAWIEERVDHAVADPDDTTWQSIPGGDAMSVEIRREGCRDVSQVRTKPIRKYSNLMLELGKLAQFGSTDA